VIARLLVDESGRWIKLVSIRTCQGEKKADRTLITVIFLLANRRLSLSIHGWFWMSSCSGSGLNAYRTGSIVAMDADEEDFE
jgi:hypothetical protein